MKTADTSNRILRAAGIPFIAGLMACSAVAQTITVTNNCGYTIYPGIYPAVYQNGGWEMAPNTSVTFSPGSTFNGRIWGRISCNSSSPAQCSTGQCGGTGLQCAGTTGQAGTSLAEFNLDANGTDWYDVSYVDGFDNPIGITSTNSSCVSPNTCTNAPLTSCPSNLSSGAYCLSPCTTYNTDQFCCRGAYGSSSTCIVSQWPSSDQQYVTDIHNSCPNQYAYPYDDSVGLHTCPTGGSYTVTFCPNGSGAASFNGAHTLTPQNATGSRMDDDAASTAAGNPIDVYTANGTGAQTWVFSNQSVVPAGDYNLAVSFGAYCANAAGSSSGSVVNLEPCDGASSQSWNVVATNGFYELQPANGSNLCLDVPGTANYTQLQVTTCTGSSSQLWAIN